MIKKILKETFFCDFCEKKSKEVVAGEGFPYDKGWTYIYNFTFKVKESISNKSRDKHFCSKHCLAIFLGSKISEGCEE